MKRINYIVLILLLAGVAIFFVYENTYNKKHPDYEEIAVAFDLSPKQLYEEFTGDAVTASEKYNDKVISVSAENSKLEKGDSLLTAVFVFNEGMFGDEGVRCTFLSHFADLNESDLTGAKIKGVCRGYNEVDVILEKCSIIKE